MSSTKDSKLLGIISIVAGAVVAALGALWALQGADLVHIDPIACVGDCKPVSGFSPLWLALGLVALAAGAALIGWGVRSLRRRQRVLLR